MVPSQEIVENNRTKNALISLVRDIFVPGNDCNSHPVVSVPHQCSPVVHHSSHTATNHPASPLVTANRFDVIAEVSEVDDFSTSPAPEIAPLASSCSEDVPLVAAYVHSTPIEVFLDTGSPVNIINKDLVTKLGLIEEMTPTSIILNSVSSNSLFTEGEISLTIRIRGADLTLTLIVVRSCVFPGDIMLGFQSMRENDITLIPAHLTIVMRGVTIPLTSKCSAGGDNPISSCEPFHALSRNVASCLKPTVHVNIGSGRYYNREPKDNERHLTVQPLLSAGFVVRGTNVQPNSTQVVKLRLRNRGYVNATSVPESCKNHRLNIEEAIYSIDPSDNTVPLRVANLSNQQITLRTNSILLEFNLLKDELFIEDLPQARVCAVSSSPDARINLKETILPENVHFPEALPELIELLTNYREILPDPDAPLTRTNIGKHSISLKPDTKPVYVHAYRLPHSRRELVEEMITDMSDKKVIRPSHSPWNAPMILVPKKNGSLRPVIDYRKLNDCTIDDRYPIPVLSDLLREIGPGNTVFTTIDLTSGFWQVELEEASKPLTAFSTPGGHWEFNSMPFGLKGAPLTFSRIMANVFHGLLGKSLLLYLDDMIIVSKTMKEHMEKLEVVFSKLKGANLLINPEKCNFLKKELDFLGHTVSVEGCKPNQDKVSALHKLPRPKCARDISVFMGMLQFYREYIPGFSILACPLTELLKKDVTFTWDARHESAFNTLRNCLTNPPVLVFPDFNEPFIVTTDACKYGIGGCLSQVRGTGRQAKKLPIAFFSKKCSPAEMNFSVTDLEGLAVIRSLDYFKDIIMGYPIIVETDHIALKQYLSEGKDAQGRVSRWIAKVALFGPEIRYVPGKLNVVADCLSRQVACIEPINREHIKTLQQQDPTYAALIIAITNNTTRPKIPRLPVDDFYLSDGLLYRSSKPASKRSTQSREYNQLVVPEAYVPTLLKLLHNSRFGAHVGEDKCVKTARKKYFFQKMQPRISEHIKACETCARFKGHTHPEAPILTMTPPSMPFERVAMDVVNIGRSSSGNDKVLTMICCFSRYCRLVAIPDKKPETIIKAFNTAWVCTFGTPKTILTDNGGEFVCHQMTKYCNDCNIEQVTSTPYHPQGNGICERVNQEILKAIRFIFDKEHGDWDNYLPEVQLTINAGHHSSINESPHYLIFAQDIRLPYDLHNQPRSPVYNPDDYAGIVKRRKQLAFQAARKALGRANEAQMSAQHKVARPKEIEEGRLIWIKRRPLEHEPQKLMPRFEGPYRVTRSRNHKVTAELLSDPSQIKTVHLDQVKPHVTSSEPFPGLVDIQV